jgi:glycosyltransferase involved in cell wall biosynthesis
VALAVRRDHRNAAGASVTDHVDSSVQVIELPRRLFTRRALTRAIEAFRPDIIHCHLRRAARLVARINPDCATVATLHIGVNGPHFARIGGLVCNARWQMQQLPPSYGGLVYKANNSLVPQRRLSPPEIAAIRAGLDVPAGAVLVGGVGRLARSKGWDTLIRAVRSRPELNNLRVVIAGSGSAEASLRKLIGGDGRIRLLGHRKDVKELYQAFDVFVCPSRFEPLPRVMLEAMDAGTPVIASSADGCRELVEDYGGDLFDVDDVQTLADLLAAYVLHRRPRTQIDLRAHHIEEANAAIVDFYRRLIEARQQTRR